MILPRPTPRRRRFLSDTAATLATAFAGALLFPALDFAGENVGDAARESAGEKAGEAAAADDVPHIDFPTAPRERIAIASYSFRQFITPTESGELSTPVTSGSAQSSATSPAKM